MPTRVVFSALFCLLSLFFTGCETSRQSVEQIATRRQQLASEPRGDFYIGRRFHIDHTHFWGYLRRPGESWDSSRLVIMNERYMKIPNRLPEASSSGESYGDDHNREYRMWGRYTGRRVFDPNSNLILPEFELQRWELINANPGWLFKPGERFNGSQLFRGEPSAIP